MTFTPTPEELKQMAMGAIKEAGSGFLSGDDPVTLVTALLEPKLTPAMKGALGHKYLGSMGWYKDYPQATNYYNQNKGVIDGFANQISLEAIARFWREPINRTVMPYVWGAALGVALGAGTMWYVNRYKNSKKEQG